MTRTPTALARLTAKAKRPSEKQEQAAIVQLIRAVGGHAYVIGTRRKRGDFQGTMQTPGIPDVFAFLPFSHGGPRSAWIEVKRIGGRMSPEQVTFQGQCQERGVYHIVGGHDAVASAFKQWGLLR